MEVFLWQWHVYFEACELFYENILNTVLKQECSDFEKFPKCYKNIESVS
jgi:hypothetical protein